MMTPTTIKPVHRLAPDYTHRQILSVLALLESWTGHDGDLGMEFMRRRLRHISGLPTWKLSKLGKECRRRHLTDEEILAFLA